MRRALRKRLRRNDALSRKVVEPRFESTSLLKRVGVSDARPGPQIGKLSEEYLGIRNRQMSTKALTAEMQLAERRGELIEKRLVERQAAFLLIAMRQKILNLPQTYARRMVGLKDAAQASKTLREMAISVLTELSDLPTKVTDPNWLETLEKDEGK